METEGKTGGSGDKSIFSKHICEGTWSTVAATCINMTVFWDITPCALVFFVPLELGNVFHRNFGKFQP